MSRFRAFLVGLTAAVLLGLPAASPARAASPEDQRFAEEVSWRALLARVASLFAAINPGGDDETGDVGQGTTPSTASDGESDSGPNVDPDG
jgi:hypothetical protein